MSETLTVEEINSTLAKLVDANLEPILDALDFLVLHRRDIDSSILPDLVSLLNQLSSTLQPSAVVFSLNVRSALLKKIQEKVNALVLWGAQMQCFQGLELLKSSLSAVKSTENSEVEPTLMPNVQAS